MISGLHHFGRNHLFEADNFHFVYYFYIKYDRKYGGGHSSEQIRDRTPDRTWLQLRWRHKCFHGFVVSVDQRNPRVFLRCNKKQGQWFQTVKPKVLIITKPLDLLGQNKSYNTIQCKNCVERQLVRIIRIYFVPCATFAMGSTFGPTMKK